MCMKTTAIKKKILPVDLARQLVKSRRWVGGGCGA